jgi:hypothetical protein
MEQRNNAKWAIQYILNKRHSKFCQHLLWFEKSAKKEKLGSIHVYYFVEQKTEGRKPNKYSSPRRLELMPGNLDQKLPFKNTTSGL